MSLPKKYQNIKRELKVKKSLAGLGLFTKSPIEKGGFVIEYVGPILNEKESNEKGGKYLFETSANRFIEGSARTNTARYINHSCRPNCEIDVRRGRVLVFAKRNIKADEELGYDYEKEYFDEYIKPYGCKCEKCMEERDK
ncbi:MAG: SET domain-containing protein-lysine N-methyltransferase [Parcubacteria group bacterium]